MKKISTILLLLLTGINSYNCSSKKSVANTYTLSHIVSAAQVRWPGATEHTITAGETIYNTRCIRCHGAKSIDKWNESDWEKILVKMAPKAKLTAEEKETTRQYILAKLDVLTKTQK